MPVLDPKRFQHDEHYAAFVDLQQPLNVGEHEWPRAATYDQNVFFCFNDSLCDIICSATRTYLPFDAHALTQLTRPHQILSLSAEWLIRAHILSLTPSFYLRDNIPS